MPDGDEVLDAERLRAVGSAVELHLVLHYVAVDCLIADSGERGDLRAGQLLGVVGGAG